MFKQLARQAIETLEQIDRAHRMPPPDGHRCILGCDCGRRTLDPLYDRLERIEARMAAAIADPRHCRKQSVRFQDGRQILIVQIGGKELVLVDSTGGGVYLEEQLEERLGLPHGVSGSVAHQALAIVYARPAA